MRLGVEGFGARLGFVRTGRPLPCGAARAWQELHCCQCIPRRVGTSSAKPASKAILRDLFIGACIAGMGAVLVWHFYPGFWKESPDAAQEIALQQRAELLHAQQQAPAATVAAVQPAPAPGPCELPPLIPPGNARDGHASAEHPFPGGPRERAKVFLRQAQDAAARGRQRDAEVALLATCRELQAASTRPTVPLARVLGMLGDRYAAAAAAEPPSALREQLAARAREVLDLGAQAYASALGPNSSRSRQARQRVAMLEEELVAATDGPQAVDRPRDDAAPAPPKPVQRPAKASPAKVVTVHTARTNAQPARQPPPPAPVTQQPDPEPARPRASLESDPDLKQLASDLARLQAQAEAVSDDPAGFRRRADAARAARDQCQDAACARDWYAKRRRQLLAEF